MFQTTAYKPNGSTTGVCCNAPPIPHAPGAPSVPRLTGEVSRSIRDGELRRASVERRRLKTPVIGTCIFRKLTMMQSETSFRPLLWGD